MGRLCRRDVEAGAHSSTWAIICPREGGGGGVGAAASSRWQMLASQSKMAARAPGRALACLSSPACHPDTEGGAHSSTWAIIWPREGGGGGVGAAASCPVANARLTVQDGGSHAQPCSGASIGSRLLPVSLSYRHDDNKLPLTLTLTLTLTRRTRSIHRELASTDRWFLHSDPKRPVLRSCTTA